ncbi:hypothetical protein Q5P01_015369 [Channa striata]|uniref:AIG1-type G domain-containing protein n=1 Tax=Channa striata TaxID=64152 RepID=A0AA88MKI3_CHASR|nr:hypothetical protein Q5P01_015369 [Channa striata]
MEIMTVFTSNERENLVYRIPALVYDPDGKILLSFAEKRRTKNDAHSLALLMRKGTVNKDKSVTFEPEKEVVKKTDKGRPMNPCPVYEKSSKTLFLFFIRVEGEVSEQQQIKHYDNKACLCYVTSTDAGENWSEEIDLPEYQDINRFDIQAANNTPAPSPVYPTVYSFQIISSPGPRTAPWLYCPTILASDELIGRFTQEEEETLKLIKEGFGNNSEKFTIILFTRGNSLKDEKRTIVDYINEGCDDSFKKLISDCGDRYHVFNNYDKDNYTQVSELITKIDTMVKESRAGYYTTEMFQEAEEAIQKKVQRILKEREEEMQKERDGN